jgi:hypothetical protein
MFTIVDMMLKTHSHTLLSLVEEGDNALELNRQWQEAVEVCRHGAISYIILLACLHIETKFFCLRLLKGSSLSHCGSP